MKNIKYYILAYSMLTYLFIEKYITLLYLLFKVHFVDNNKNYDYVLCGDSKRQYEFNWNKKTNYIVLIHAFINKDMENQISFNTYERYDEMYAPLFYN